MVSESNPPGKRSLACFMGAFCSAFVVLYAIFLFETTIGSSIYIIRTNELRVAFLLAFFTGLLATFPLYFERRIILPILGILALVPLFFLLAVIICPAGTQVIMVCGEYGFLGVAFALILGAIGNILISLTRYLLRSENFLTGLLLGLSPILPAVVLHYLHIA